MLQLGAVTEDSEGEPGGGYWRGRQGGTALPQPLAFLQVGQYVSRAEELKAIVSSSNRALLRQETSARDLLKEMARDKPRLLAALEVASAAMAKAEEAGGEQDALVLYQHSLGELLLLLAAEPPGRRRELLHTEVQNLMARAEYLKEQVKMRESRWEAETLDKEGLLESVRSSCTLQ